MITKVKWGLISAANIARRRFMPAMLNSHKAEMIAVGSRDANKAKEFASIFNIPKYYGSYQEVIDDPEVEAVYIAVPNNWHAEWTIKAAEAGKHVLCEKPIALDAEEATAMVKKCKECGVILMEAFMYRFHPRTLKIKQLIDDGLIGEPRNIIADFSFTLEPRHNARLIPGKGAGSLMDVGCYCINVSRYVYDSEPIAVAAHFNVHPEIGCDMTASALLEFQDGKSSLINSSFETAFRNRLQIAGTDGIIYVEKFAIPGEGVSSEIIHQNKSGDIYSITIPEADQYLNEIDHFSDCIRNNTPPRLDPFKDAVANMKVIDTVRKSAESQSRIQMHQ